MEATAIVHSPSPVDSSIGPIVLPFGDDSGGDNSNLLAASRKRKRNYVRWDFDDECAILMELAAGVRESGLRPPPSKLLQTLQAKGVLNRRNVTKDELMSKIYVLKEKFILAINNGGPGNRPHDQKLYELSKEVWPEVLLEAPGLI